MKDYTFTSVTTKGTEKDFHYIISDGEKKFELDLDRDELKLFVEALAYDLGHRNIFSKQSMSRAVKEKFSEIEDRLEKMVSLNFGNGFDVEEKDGVVEVVAVDKQLTEEDVRRIVREEMGSNKYLKDRVPEGFTNAGDRIPSYVDEVYAESIRKFKQD